MFQYPHQESASNDRREWRPGARFGRLALVLGLAGMALLPFPVAATPVVTGAFEQFYNVGLNNLGFTSGSLIRYGATVTSAAGSSNLSVIQDVTTATGSTTNLSTGQPVMRNLSYVGSPVTGGMFSGVVGYNANLTGPWTLSFSDGAGQPAVVTTAAIPQGAQPTPFAQSITLSGTGNNPTFTWAPPAGTVANGYRINIYDSAQIAPGSPNGQILSSSLSAGTNSFTVTSTTPGLPSGYAFNTTSRYSIEIAILQTRDGSGTNLANSNIYATSRVYADFRITNSGDIQVNLPVAKVNGAYVFDMAVQPGVTYNIDPDVATGYRYAIGTGNPNFASVVLPLLQADPYRLSYMFGSTLFDVMLAGGMQYFFPAGGVNAFNVTGIDPGLGLDPANPVAFITALTFTSQGQFTGTMAPITTFVAVPEPASMGLLLIGALGVWFAKRRDARLTGHMGHVHPRGA